MHDRHHKSGIRKRIEGNTLTFEREDGSFYFLLVSPPPVVEAVLKLADLQPGEVLYDLGSGDGRILIQAVQRSGVRAVGIESHGDLVAYSLRRIEELGLNKRITVQNADYNEQDLQPADVLVFFLGPEDLNEALSGRLRQRICSGARLITINCPLSGQSPSAIKEMTFADRSYTLRLYDKIGKTND